MFTSECEEAIEECNAKFIQTFMYDLMSYQQATEFILDYGEEKDFLVRRGTVNETFILSFKQDNEVNHVNIIEMNGWFQFEGQPF